MRLDSVHFSMLVIGVSFACYSPSLNSLQDQAYKSAVVIEGKVQAVPVNVSKEPYSVNVKVLDVWPLNSGGLEREQLVTVGEFGSEAPCTKVKKNHKYIFFMDPTDEPLVFKASYAPLDTYGKNLKKDVGKILCEDCASAPRLKRLRNQLLEEGDRLALKCEATGNPGPAYTWYKDGSELKKSKEIKIKSSKKNSRVQINRVKLEDAGNYTCVAENLLGKENTTSTINVQSITTTLSPGSGHARRCNETEKAYCVNDGDCYFIHGINQLSCKCPNDYNGDRCQTYVMDDFYSMFIPSSVRLQGYCMRELTCGMCRVCPSFSPAVSHPMCPSPLQYISKNAPATERVIRHGAEASFSGSRASSRSHHTSSPAHSSTHRHEDRTWSLDRTESALSDSPSGMASSSVGTSKCNSPACMEARARRAAHCGITEPHHPAARYRDSFDSLGDSPHSDRYVSALTTPARLSPVDFHYSLPPQVPTFQITSPNTSHAMSLPPAARASYQPEDDQPLLRRYQQRRTYLDESTGSLPSSPYRPADDDEYETTQEYLSSLEKPKRSGSNGRRWRRSRLNGHVSQRGEAARDCGSRSCLSDSESEEEDGESTPFLSMQNMSTEPSTIYRPAEARTHQPSGRQSSRGNVPPRLTLSRSKQDSAPQ
uniref:Neuregulin 2 n=1 Tax=Paramormyrops kingsleyae TaxID=1676925 RepID=A0A3B3QCJ3_9TELE